MTQIIKSVDLRHGVKLVYAEQGDPSGTPMLLLHGYTDSWRSFERVLPGLPQSIHAIALSQRGHGDSDRPMSGYAPGDFARDLAAFMDELELGPAIIVGHSMGSAVAQGFALDHPERTLGLVLMGSFNPPSGNVAVRELWGSSISTITDPIDEEFVLAFQRSTVARPVPDTFLATIVQESLKVPAAVWRLSLEAFLQADFSQELRRIDAATLIVWGDRDAFCARWEQEVLAAAIRRARLVVFPGAGHGFHWEEPKRFAALVAAFADELERPISRRGHDANAERSHGASSRRPAQARRH